MAKKPASNAAPGTSHFRSACDRVFDDAAHGSRGWGVTATDVAVAVAGLVLAGLAWAALWGFTRGGAAPTQDAPGTASPAPLYAVVLNTEGFRAELPLNQDGVFPVEGSLGKNTVEVAGGRVRCVEADCSNQVCVDTGWVQDPGQMIVCLPHELTVQVVADPADAVPLA